MTNDLGHRLAQFVGDKLTLGAYRRGNRLPWVPGATIDVWMHCARGEHMTGVPAPHVYFVQTIGGDEEESIYCPACRTDVAATRSIARPSMSTPPPRPRPPVPQGDLPF